MSGCTSLSLFVTSSLLILPVLSCVLSREGIASLRDFNYSWSVMAAQPDHSYPAPGLYTLLAIESIKDLVYISSLQGHPSPLLVD
jgi:hypothetical protein